MPFFTDFNADIYSALNVAAVTNLLDAYGSGVALFASSILPEDFTDNKSINFYRVAPLDNTIEYGDGRYSASCRAATEEESLTIASAVVNAINRKSYVDYFIKTSIGVTIRPEATQTDNFNTPVEITIYKR